ncbi:MAG: transport system permease protein [Bacteroidetes bacterium]|nr:transport system permease protein [Bacteroidota bacterium]
MSRNLILFTVLLLFCLLLLLTDIAFGSIPISLHNLWQTFLHPETDSLYKNIVFDFRLPKALTAILCGAALSVAGLLMQTLFRNPLAGPDVLGISSGASMGVALYVMAASWWSASLLQSSWGMVGAAVIGALLVLMLTLAVATRIRQSVTLLIVGLMFASVAGAVVSILQNFSNPDAVKLFVVWTFGSLSAVTWAQMELLIPIILVGLILTFWLQKSLNVMLLGEHYARGLGISVTIVRVAIILITGVLAGTITAFTGPIAFIGVAVPHLARGIFGTSNHRIAIPGTILCGAALLLLCDVISQQTTYPLPLNAVSALFGAPMIIWIVLKQR